jgi:hypothetical protein
LSVYLWCTLRLSEHNRIARPTSLQVRLQLFLASAYPWGVVLLRDLDARVRSRRPGSLRAVPSQFETSCAI